MYLHRKSFLCRCTKKCYLHHSCTNGELLIVLLLLPLLVVVASSLVCFRHVRWNVYELGRFLLSLREGKEEEKVLVSFG